MAGGVRKKPVDWNVPLSDLLTRLIADSDSVSEAQVTVEYIQNRREKAIYPETRYHIGSDYGGYHNHHLEVMTRDELDKLAHQVDDAISKH